jgi:hypothetical protein
VDTDRVHRIAFHIAFHNLRVLQLGALARARRRVV